MQIHDPIGLIKPERMLRLLSEVGLPRTATVRLIDNPMQQAHYHVAFPPDSGIKPHELRIEVSSPGHDTTRNEATAIFYLEDHPVIKTVSDFRLIPTQLFGRPAAIHSVFPGLNGIQLASKNLDFAHGVFRDLGQVMAALAAVPIPSFGRRGEGAQFVPSENDWANEVFSYGMTMHRKACALGTDLAGISRQLIDGIEERMPVLSEVKSFSLVHRNLTPLNLRYTVQSEPTLSGVLYWSMTMSGDPLMEWATPLFLKAEALKEVQKGYGNPEMFEDPDVFKRIEAYFYLQCLALLERHSDAMHYLPTPTASRIRQETIDAALKALKPDWVATRLGTPANPKISVQAPLAVPELSALRHICRALATSPPVPRGQSALIIVGLASCLLSSDLPPGPLANRAMNIAFQTTQPLGQQSQWQSNKSKIHPDSWRKTWIEKTVRPLLNNDTPSMCMSLVVLWLVLESIQRLETVSTSVYLGAETLIRALLSGEEQTRDVQPGAPVMLSQSLLGLAAITSLSGLEPSFENELATLKNQFEDYLAEAWDLIDVMAVPGAPVHFDLDSITKDLLMQQPDNQIERVLLPLKVYAFRTIANQAKLPSHPLKMAKHIAL